MHLVCWGGKSDLPPPHGLELSLAIHHLRMMAQKWEAVGMANSKGWASLRPPDAKGRNGCILGFLLLGSPNMVRSWLSGKAEFDVGSFGLLLYQAWSQKSCCYLEYLFYSMKLAGRVTHRNSWLLPNLEQHSLPKQVWLR